MFSDDIVKKYSIREACELNLQLVKKQWHDDAWIMRRKSFDGKVSQYWLIENLDGEQRLTISEQDALYLIKELNLKTHSDSEIFLIEIYKG